MKSIDVDAAGITLYTERHVPIDHARYSAEFRGRVRRFTRVQRALLGIPSTLDGTLAGRLIAFDLVPVAELAPALAAEPYRYRDTLCIEWTCGMRLDRRALCALSVLCPRDGRSTEREAKALVALVQEIKGYKNLKIDEVLHELDLDRISWAAERLPKALWSHVAGVRHFTLLSRADLGNEDPYLVPAHVLDPELCETQAQLSNLLDVAVAAGRRLEVMPAVVQMAGDALGIDSKLSDADNLRKWGRRLLGLRPHVERADVAAALVVAWNYHLVTNGTSTEANAKLTTRARYARVANSILWRMLSSLPSNLEQWTVEHLAAGYESMMLNPGCKDKKGLGAAIASFQDFFEHEFGISVPTRGLHKLIPEARPHAKWISPAAIKRALGWLSKADRGDSRLLDIAELMLRLGSSAAFRIGELRWLRLSSLYWAPDGSLEIEVTPVVGAHPLKTEAAKRRVQIRDAEACSTLRRWQTKRTNEGAPSSAFLFGEPAQDECLYRPHAVHVLLLELLKRATGDAEVSFHSLRHTVISDQLEAIFFATEPTAVNRLTAMADAAGHVVAATSMQHYGHRFELPLREAIDRELRSIEATPVIGSRLIDVKPNTLTQGARRAEESLTNHVWSICTVRASELAAKLPDVTAGMVLATPSPPRFSGPVARHFTVMRCLAALQALNAREDAELIDHRHGLDREQQALLQRAALDAVKEVYSSRLKLPPIRCTDVRTAIETLELDLDRAAQPRYSALVDALSLPQQASILCGAAAAWTAAWWQGELSAALPEQLLPLLQLLRLGEAKPEDLLFKVEPDFDDSGWIERYRREADAVAFSVFNARIPVESLKSRRGDRSTAYLIWTSGAGVGPAGKSNGGLDAVMFALAVWSQPCLAGWR